MLVMMWLWKHNLTKKKKHRAIEDAIEPYAEQKRELKAEFKEQGWLTGDEISVAVKAYRMLKADQDIEELVEMFNFLRGDK